MRFVSGIKNLFKEPVYVFAILSFILTWILILINFYIRNPVLGLIIFIFGGGLLFFSIILFFISFFTPVSNLKKYVFLVIFIISFTLSFFLLDSIYFPTSEYFYIIPLFANQFFTAFFAFKLCMDSSTVADDFLYQKEKSRKITRILEFLLFGLLILWLMRTTLRFFSLTTSSLFVTVIRIIVIMFWVYAALMGFVLLRLLIKKNFSAYITLFFFLTFCYVLYIIFDFIFGAFYSNESGDPFYIIISFVVDVGIFLYMTGTIYSRIDYIKEKIKFLKIDSIALFLIIMKIYVQLSKLVPRTILPELQILQAGGLFIIFVICTLLFGIHSIFAHKPKEKKDIEKISN